jgi:hypothetical protein
MTAKSVVTRGVGPLDEAEATTTVVVARAVPTFTNLRNKLRLLLNVPHDGSKGVAVSHPLILKECESASLIFVTFVTDKPLLFLFLPNRYFRSVDNVKLFDNRKGRLRLWGFVPGQKRTGTEVRSRDA